MEITDKQSRIVTQNTNTAIKDWFQYYFDTLKVGLITSIVGASHLKSGCGKSYTGIRLGEIFDKDYSNGTTAIDKIAWKPSDFTRAMSLVESHEHTSGQIVVVDEAGILINSKKWFSFLNRSISDAVATFRILRGMAIFISPAFFSIEKDVRMFVSHLGFTKKQIVMGNPMVKLYLYSLYWDEIQPKYFKYRITMYLKEQQRLARFNYFFVKHPENKELIAEYEERAKHYKSQVRGAVVELDKIDKGYQEYVNEIIEQGEILTDTSKGKRVYPEDIREQYGTSVTTSMMIARRVNDALKKASGAVYGL